MIISHMERGKQVECVYTDFSKAFDTVPHDLLLNKLQVYGVGEGVIKWISSYLENRPQCVKIGGSLSTPTSVKSGVPQGSHIGPLLFAILINDLIHKIGSIDIGCSANADDLKISQPVATVFDCVKLQSAVDLINDWCHQNGMNLNASKCQVISFTKKLTRVKYS